MAGIYRGIKLQKSTYGLYEFFIDGIMWRVSGLARTIENIDAVKGRKE
jgi:hypothetical protein